MDVIRRKIIQSLAIASLPFKGSGFAPLPVKGSRNFIEGFIVSDAHIGFTGADQPSLAEQAQAVSTIVNRFPGLDLAFDTGDIHHGNLRENDRIKARNSWLKIVSSQFSDSLFHYIPGNHELSKGPSDEEITASRLGNCDFRPYYSFDYKGIHFVSLPELLDTILVNRETLTWLEHDLMLNKGKSTLIFSHNSIKGTTFYDGQDAYRCLVNSEEVLSVLDKHPAVLAWFHGHNHQYEIVKKHNRLYVSNGRIGGFNPPARWGNFGQGHLGGIYFRISRAGLLVRAFSATENRFLDQLGMSHLTAFMETTTSFDNNQEVNYYCGHGALTDRVTYDLYNHYLTKEPIKVQIRPLGNVPLNDNQDFRYPSDLRRRGEILSKVIGYWLPEEVSRKSTSAGLLIYEHDPGKPITVKVAPGKKSRMKGFFDRASYFRCAPGDSYELKAEFGIKETKPKGSYPQVESVLFVMDRHQNLIHKRTMTMTRKNDEQGDSYLVFARVPLSVGGEEPLYARFSFRLTDFPENFLVKSFQVRKIPQGRKEELSIGSKRLKLNNRAVTCKNFFEEGVSHLTWKGMVASAVIKVPNVQWQVRNAVGQMQADGIRLVSYRHHFQKSKEVIITPTADRLFYVKRLFDSVPATVSMSSSSIKVVFDKITPKTKIEVYTKIPITKLSGAEKVLSSGHSVIIFPASRKLEISFA